VITELNGTPIAYIEAAKRACERNPQVKCYLGELELSKNWLALLGRINPYRESYGERKTHSFKVDRCG
jgi:hypothetical protein